jgi:indole-3-glycerol phosphate synthase
VTLLDDLVSSTRARIAELERVVNPDAFDQRIAAAEAPRGFARSLEGADVAIVAEIKRRSPAVGDLDPALNPRDLAAAYRAGGAAAISVLTEPDHFGGSMEDLGAAREAGLPVLRKDFILDELQLLEARAWGADAVLIIVRCVGEELAGLIDAAATLGMDPLVEIHDEADLERALDVGARVIGVNHRDLATFGVDPDRTAKLAPLVPDDRLLISLSGVATRADVDALARAGASAVVVGETLVRAADPAAALRALVRRS